MSVLLMGRKVGMTRVFTEKGANVPVTVLSVGPCVVTQVKTDEGDGYAAVQVGYDEVKPKNSTFPMIAHDAKAGTTPKRFHREFRVDAKGAGQYSLGQTLDVSALDGQMFVDVMGQSKGKGYAGGMSATGSRATSRRTARSAAPGPGLDRLVLLEPWLWRRAGQGQPHGRAHGR